MRTYLLLWLGSFFLTPNIKGQTDTPLKLVFHSDFEKQVLTDSSSDRKDKNLAFLLIADEKITPEKYVAIKHNLQDFLIFLEKKRIQFKKKESFLWYVFEETHRKYLKKYQTSEPFSRIFGDGVYNCVSATALFALILEKLGFDYQIYETAFHAYLIVKVSESKKALLESTDRQSGFMMEKIIIKRTEKSYQQPETPYWGVKAGLCNRKNLKACPVSYKQAISPGELAGIQYLNEAIECYNRSSFREADVWLGKAQFLYPDSKRIEGLKKILPNLNFSQSFIQQP